MRLALLAIFLPALAAAQQADCPAEPIGPPLPLAPRIDLPGGRGRVQLDLGPVPIFGTICTTTTPPPADVLRGAPAPRGLLQGDGPRDVLHNRWQGEVTIRPSP